MPSPNRRPRILVVGPGPSQIGGVATFLGILFSSPQLRARYDLIHLDTTRGKHGAGIASRFALINIVYFVRQAIQFFCLTLRYQPRLMHVPVTSFWAFWKDAAFIITAQSLGMKVVAHLHGGVFDRYYCTSPLLVRRAIGWVMHRADVVVVLSNRWKQFLLGEVRKDIKVEIVPNTIDPTLAQVIGQAYSFPNRELNMVLFVGGLGHRKGVYDTLKAVPIVVERRPETRFVFAGTEESRGEQAKIDQICAQAHLDGNVQFLGQVVGDAKLSLFLKATIFILPSHGENMPYSLLEAMGAGLPVVTTPVGAIPELVVDGCNGFLIQPGDYQALAGRIVQLLENPALRTKMSRANVELIRMNYMPEVAMARFDAIYNGALGGLGPS